MEKGDLCIDWIDYIAEKVYLYYKNRKIVLWGKYDISDQIKERLNQKYGLETAFYVDSDISKIDERRVFPVDKIWNKSEEYYIVIPLAFYKSLKENLIWGGIRRT